MKHAQSAGHCSGTPLSRNSRDARATEAGGAAGGADIGGEAACRRGGRERAGAGDRRGGVCPLRPHARGNRPRRKRGQVKPNAVLQANGLTHASPGQRPGSTPWVNACAAPSGINRFAVPAQGVALGWHVAGPLALKLSARSSHPEGDWKLADGVNHRNLDEKRMRPGGALENRQHSHRPIRGGFLSCG